MYAWQQQQISIRITCQKCVCIHLYACVGGRQWHRCCSQSRRLLTPLGIHSSLDHVHVQIICPVSILGLLLCMKDQFGLLFFFFWIFLSHDLLLCFYYFFLINLSSKQLSPKILYVAGLHTNASYVCLYIKWSWSLKQSILLCVALKKNYKYNFFSHFIGRLWKFKLTDDSFCYCFYFF